MAVKRESIDLQSGSVTKSVTVTDIHRNPAGDWIATVLIEVAAVTEDGRFVEMKGERTVKGWQRGRRARAAQ